MTLTEKATRAETLEVECKALQQQIKSREGEFVEMSTKLLDENKNRKSLLNELEDLKGKIRVYCRIRPFSKSELEDEERRGMAVKINDHMSITVHGRIDNTYNFDSVFGMNTTQDQVF